jgi:hypothetical protein
MIGDALRAEFAAISSEVDRLDAWADRVEQRGGLTLRGEPAAFRAALADLERRRKAASTQVAGMAGPTQ